MASQFFTPSTTTTSCGGDTVYVATVPLKAAVGPPQLMMSMAYSLNLPNLQHFVVLIKPSSSILQEVLVFDFQPRNPESIEAAVSVLSRRSIPGVILQRKLKNVPRQKCWKVGSSKENALEMAKEFNSSWETNLRVGVHDCRHYTNGIITKLNLKDFGLFNKRLLGFENFHVCTHNLFNILLEKYKLWSKFKKLMIDERNRHFIFNYFTKICG